MRLPAASNRSQRKAWVASKVPLPGNAMPRASFRQFMLLAVNMPEQLPAGRTSRALVFVHLGVGDALVGRSHHRVDQVELPPDQLAVAIPVPSVLPASMGPPENEDGRDVQAHRRHQHARRDLVAVGDTHERIGAVGIDHVLDAVCDEFAARQRIQHAVVAMAMPSSTAMVLNSTPQPPAWSMTFFTRCPTS